MEKHVTSLELSKRLKALGVKQESQYYWIKVNLNGEIVWQLRDKLPPYDDYPSEYWCSAFLASELGEIFWKITNENVGKGLFIKAYGEVSGFKGTGCVGDIGVMNLLREPDRLALMLEYLILNKMI